MTAGDGWPDDPGLRDFIDQVVTVLERRGWTAQAAAARLRRDAWWPLLAGAGATVMAMCAPEDVASEVDRQTPCGVCGHPLHRALGDVRLRLLGRLRLIHRLPHVAPCSCGYADRTLDAAVAEALLRHFTRCPDDVELDAADARFAAEVRLARGGAGTGA